MPWSEGQSFSGETFPNLKKNPLNLSQTEKSRYKNST